MKFRKPIAIFGIIAGIGMLGIWILQIISGQAVELETAPIEIAMAITADCLTALMLIISGTGLLRQSRWANKLYLFALGMLVYSVLISSGYFGQLGDAAFVVMFAVLFAISAFFVISNTFSKTE